uniref:G-protein coupled receptors family 1 profile domain-containing protein n=1 Tax=Laticauda laticaudata TaxID=8630 RepID=A0A8C5SGD1_LATLA
MKNSSTVTKFILIGFSSSVEKQMIIFWTFLLIYGLALVRNFLIILAISICRKLHTPMYFLLINLSIINVSSISIIVSKLLQIILTQRKTIVFPACIAQVFLFTLTLGTEFLLLAFMAFDSYSAICQPLQYTVIMRKEVCFGTMSGLWLIGIINSSVQTGLVLRLYFCDSNIINHFFCYLPPMSKISCSCTLTFLSYWFILRSIFRIRSTEGKKKAFSTCSFHLLVVNFYYSTIIYTFLHPASMYSLEEDKVIAIIYSVVTPVLNPLIYSLRNTDVKQPLRKLIDRKFFYQDLCL